jgi:hypothetical protein
MSFNTQDFHTLLDDKHTVISMASNSIGEGEYTIVMNGFVRPQSPLKDNFLNPHRNMSKIPPQYVRTCPRCDGDWIALAYDIKNGKMKNTFYTCSSNCGVSICSLTYDKFVRNSTDANHNLDIVPSVVDSMAREAEYDLPKIVFGGEAEYDLPKIVFGGGN